MNEQKKINPSHRDDTPASDSPPQTEDKIGLLIRLAGQRPAAPDPRSDRVKDVVRAHWKEEVRRRSRRRRIRFAVGMATAAMIMVGILGIWNWSTLFPPEIRVLAKVEAIEHPVWIRARDTGRSLTAEVVGVGTSIPIGSEVATEGEGRLALRMASGVSVRIDVDTRAKILSSTSLYLERGAIYVDTGRSGDEALSSVMIQTSSGIIRDFGTQFEVRKSRDSLRIRVREGRVVFEQTEESHEVEVGTEFTIDGDGAARRRPISTWEPEWEWVSAITPPVALDGLSLESFLNWYSRERGWQLRFQDEMLASSTSRIMLSGSMQGLSLEEALDAVLVTSQLRYRIDRGVLFIASR